MGQLGVGFYISSRGAKPLPLRCQERKAVTTLLPIGYGSGAWLGARAQHCNLLPRYKPRVMSSASRGVNYPMQVYFVPASSNLIHKVPKQVTQAVLNRNHPNSVSE